MRLLEYGNFSELEYMFIDKTVKGAIEQINEQGHALEYAGDARKLSKIGVVSRTRRELSATSLWNSIACVMCMGRRKNKQKVLQTGENILYICGIIIKLSNEQIR